MENREVTMMHQPVSSNKVYSDRPMRDEIIEKDEVISLKIDLEVMVPDEVFDKYFALCADNRKLGHE